LDRAARLRHQIASLPLQRPRRSDLVGRLKAVIQDSEPVRSFRCFTEDLHEMTPEQMEKLFTQVDEAKLKRAQEILGHAVKRYTG
jgi:hypothetical protein